METLVRIAHPEYLVLLLLVAWHWRTLQRAGGARAHWRAAALTILVFALGGLELRNGAAHWSVMFVVDQSPSMAYGPGPQQAFSRWNTERESLDRVGVITFSDRPQVRRVLEEGSLDARLASVSNGGSGTNIEAALRAARARLRAEPAPRIALLTDGWETDGRATAEAAKAAAAGIPVDVILPAGSSAVPLEVERVHAPSGVRPGESFAITVTLRGAPNAAGQLMLREPGGAARQVPVSTGPDGRAVTTLAATAMQAGISVYEASVAPGSDALAAEPRTAGAVVVVTDRTRVLYVGDATRALPSALRRSGIDVTSQPASRLARDVSALTGFDAVVLDGVRADALDERQVRALSSYVERHGGGLLFLGSRDTLNPAVLAASGLDVLLPIDFRARSGQRAPQLGLVIAFDKSGSMDDRIDGVQRIEFARRAVRRVFESIPATDAVGVIAFDRAPTAVAPLAVGHDLTAVDSALGALEPSGATAIAPAVQLAARWLRDAGALEKRHVLLISDGRTSDSDMRTLRGIVESGGFELSVVALGDGRDRDPLASLAQATGGRAYVAADARELPTIVARESARVAGGHLVENAFVPIVASHPVTAGMTEPLPELGGYVVGAIKADAGAAILSPLADPVLATAAAGLGRVAVYTADLHGSWSARLQTWRGFDRFAAQSIRWLARAVDDDVFVSLREDRGRLHVGVELSPTVDAATRVAANIRTPSGEVKRLAIRPTSLRAYEGSFDPTEPGAYVLAIDAVDQRSVERRTLRGVYWAGSAEFANTGVNTTLLTAIARDSGGRVIESGDRLLDTRRVPTYIDLQPWLAAAALLVFLLELLWPTWPRRHMVTPHAAAARKAAA